MRFTVTALGCKTNQYEADALAGQLRDRGLVQVAQGAKADLFILNTCTVTAEAERKARQLLRRFRRDNPGALLVVCGCYSQRSDLTRLADLVTGTTGRDQLAGLILETVGNREALPLDRVQPSLAEAVYEELGVTAIPEETRAYLKIQDGCDNRCAYCAICLARGPARSRSSARVLEEARDLLAMGYRELVLTGTNLNAYGKRSKEGESPDLAGLLTDLDQLEGLDRIRLGSLESATLSPAFIEAIVKLDHLCPHFHLSLQSGSDRILRAMKRRDTVASFREGVSRIREAFPSAGITTDLIVGFPGEKDEDFEDTVSFCREIGFLRIHVFPFSARPGTAAAAMTDQVPKDQVAGRVNRLRELASELAVQAIADRLGQSRQILVEAIDQEGGAVGYSPEYLRVRGVRLAQGADPIRRGQIRTMRLDGIEGETALATVVQAVEKDLTW